VVTSQKLGLS